METQPVRESFVTRGHVFAANALPDKALRPF
jgi:hypothetical protein